MSKFPQNSSHGLNGKTLIPAELLSVCIEDADVLRREMADGSQPESASTLAAVKKAYLCAV
jgi:hypothetical protein